MSPFFLFLFILSVVSSLPHFQLRRTLAERRHSIAFQSPGLYPEGITWDEPSRRFLVGSLHGRTIHAVSSSGAVETLIRDNSLPPNSTFFGLVVDPPRHRLLAVVHALAPLPEFNALAVYDLHTRRRLFLSSLPPSSSSSVDGANDVAVDTVGNAYVTNSVANLIWKVNPDGEASIFSRSPVFTSFPPTGDPPYSYCGLNGIAHGGGGNYLLAVQTNTGKMYRVDADGSARAVSLSVDLTLADDVVVQSDGAVMVVSMHKMWFLKSEDGWGEAVVYDEVTLDVDRFPTSMTLAAEERAYVIYGRVKEGIWGNIDGEEREWFEIEEVRSEREGKERQRGVWWVGYVVAGLSLAVGYSLLKGLVRNLNKKTN